MYLKVWQYSKVGRVIIRYYIALQGTIIHSADDDNRLRRNCRHRGIIRGIRLPKSPGLADISQQPLRIQGTQPKTELRTAGDREHCQHSSY